MPKWLISYFKEIRGNALWDATKFAAMIVLGLLSLLAYRLLAALRQVPSDWLINIAIFLAVCGVYAIGLRSKRKPQQAVSQRNENLYSGSVSSSVTASRTTRMSTAQAPAASARDEADDDDNDDLEELFHWESKSPGEPPDQRQWLDPSITVEQLEKLRTKNTQLQADKHLSSYIGKWMQVSGRIGDVEKEGEFTFVVFKRGKDYKACLPKLSFRSSWDEHLVSLRRGETVSVVGRLHDVGLFGVELEECELLPYGTAPRNGAPSAYANLAQVPVEQQKDRAWVQDVVTARYLLDLYKNHTGHTAEKLAAFFRNKWMFVSDTVIDVVNDGNIIRVVLRPSDFGPLTWVEFSKNRENRLSMIRKYDTIAAIGRIHSIDDRRLQLQECELISHSPVKT